MAALVASLLLGAAAPAVAQAPPHDLDHRFLREAIERGLAEARMAELAGARASAEAVRAFARTMAEDHGRLNGRLAELARGLGIEPPAGPGEDEARVVDRLATLEGGAFDQVYAVAAAQDHMRHHNLMAEIAAQAASPELRRFGAEAVGVLDRHLVASQELRAAVRPIAQGPLGAVPGQAVPPTEATPQAEDAPYSDAAEGTEP
jgi:putative membrane protein